MPLDMPTLFLVSTCITALLGIFLLVLWLQDRSVRALGYWAAAYLIGGFAVALWIVSLVVFLPAVYLGSRLASGRGTGPGADGSRATTPDEGIR